MAGSLVVGHGDHCAHPLLAILLNATPTLTGFRFVFAICDGLCIFDSNYMLLQELTKVPLLGPPDTTVTAKFLAHTPPVVLLCGCRTGNL